MTVDPRVADHSTPGLTLSAASELQQTSAALGLTVGICNAGDGTYTAIDIDGLLSEAGTPREGSR